MLDAESSAVAKISFGPIRALTGGVAVTSTKIQVGHTVTPLVLDSRITTFLRNGVDSPREKQSNSNYNHGCSSR